MALGAQEGKGIRARVQANFARQNVMRLLGARLGNVRRGHVTIELPIRSVLAQQNGFVHAGIMATIADSAGGYAAYTMMPRDADVLTVEFKMNFMAPAIGRQLVAGARVVKSGRTLSVCELRVEAVEARERKLCAFGSQTLFCLTPARATATNVSPSSRSLARHKRNPS